jgi:hypothetical protein
MSLSYSAIIGHKKVSCPSVEGWGTNMKIQKDPPKSITTRRIEKVSETNDTFIQSSESLDRMVENISYFAKGINPSVSVDYGNYGNNGGQNRVTTGGISEKTSSGDKLHSGHAYLPFTVNKDGAFRPPVKAPFDLLPLSRIPRATTSATTNKFIVDFSKTSQFPSGISRSINENIITRNIVPSATYKINPSPIKPYEVKYVIKNKLQFDENAGNTGNRTMDITSQIVKVPTKEINQNLIRSKNVISNNGTSSNLKYADFSNMNTGKYTQDTLHSSVVSNISSNLNKTNVEDLIGFDVKKNIQNSLHSSVASNISSNLNKTNVEDLIGFDVKKNIQNFKNISYTPTKSSYTKEDLIHKDIELNRDILKGSMTTNKNSSQRRVNNQHQHQYEQKRNLPSYSFTTSNTRPIDRKDTVDINSRVYKLKPTINAGGITGRGTMT